MNTQHGAGARPIISLHEKRKFNWLVLALLLAIIIVGAVTFLA